MCPERFMQLPTSIPTLALALATSILVAACGESVPAGPIATATVTGVVKDATGAMIQGASVKIGDAATTTGADGRFELQNLPVGSATMVVAAPRFDSRSESVPVKPSSRSASVLLP